MTAAELKPIQDKIELQYSGYILNCSNKFDIPFNRIMSIIVVESRGNENAIGLAGEVGLMQLMQDAITDFNQNFSSSFTLESAKNSYNNILIGTGYFSLLKKQLNDIDLATQAYNGGIGNVKKNKNTSLSYLKKVRDVENLLLST
jgi:soluble lytic murein transglycosylase-like protein